MAVQGQNNPESFQGGSAVRLDNFYNSILGGYQRSQQQLAVQQQNEAKRLEAEQKELADMVSKVNTTGVQKIDIPDMTQKLDGLYEKYYKASKAESKADKLLLRAELQQDIQGLAQFVGQSKQRGTEQLKLSEFVGNPTNMGLVSSDALTRLKNYSNTPTAKLPTNAFSRETYISPDTSYVNRTTDTILNDLMKGAKVTREFGKPVNVLGKRGLEQFEKQTLAKEVFAEALANRYQNDVKFKNTLDFSSAQSGKTPQQTLLELVNNSTLTRTKPLANEYAYKPSEAKEDKETASTYRQQQVSGLLDKNKDALGRIRAQMLPNAKIDFVKSTKSGKSYIEITTPLKKVDGEYVGGETVTIDPNDRQAPTKLNTYINLITGENISGSKFGIEGGKPRGGQVEPKIRKTTPTKQTQKASKPTAEDLIKKYSK